MKKEDKFTYLDENNVEKVIVFKDDDFDFAQKDKNIHDVELKTKPTTFFKDAMRRFVKNKSSVAGAIILGILVLMAFIVPYVAPSHYIGNSPRNSEIKLPCKLFKSGTGWWDGTKKYSKIAYDIDKNEVVDYESRAIVKGSLKVSKKGDYYVNVVQNTAKGGYVRFWTPASSLAADYFFKSDAIGYNTNAFKYVFDIELLDENSYFNDSFKDGFDKSGYKMAPYSINFEYTDILTGEANTVVLKEQSSDYSKFSITLNDFVEPGMYSKAKLSFNIKSDEEKNSGIFIKTVSFSCFDSLGNPVVNNDLDNLSLLDANKALLMTPGTAGYWTSNGNKNLYKADMYYASFVFDYYEKAYGEIPNFKFGRTDINKYINNGWLSFEYNEEEKTITKFEILNEERCPIRSADKLEITSKKGVTVVNVYGTCSQYRYLGYSKMPSFIFGTDNNGHDIIKVTFAGLRTSLLLGFLTFLVCFVFGLCWGSISGYFGGTVDLVMERFCDILGGVPWIVLMTLIIIKWGSSFGTFAIALCLTGWMGTAARTRTQFYRFKGREYILASRTLGSSDFRLIFKHILPNSMGTIITSSVLMIPSVIFSEATISYLGLGLTDMKSLGVTLSQNQEYIQTYPALILFPSIVMALIMISFNLFGNGLRDAFNPSLKGSE